jgi:hypothetical protein
VLRIASACSTREAFVAAFGRYCDGEVIFVATPTPRSSGEELNFRITLASGEPLIAATGRVEECYLDGEGPHGRAGMVIRFGEIEPASRSLVEALAAVPDARPRGSEGGVVEVAEPDGETRPSGLPRSLAGASRATITSHPVVVPRPSSPLVVTPAATPPPVLIDRASGRVPDDEGPTGVKSMEALVAASPSRRAEDRSHEVEDEGGWDERSASDLFGARGRLRADALGQEEPSSHEPLAECAVYEESGPAVQFEERGLGGLATRRSNMPNDAWEDDETLPPWLRGPAPDDDLDAPTGAIEADFPPQTAVSGTSEPAEPRGAPPEPPPHGPSVALSGSFEREALAVVSGELPRSQGSERYFALPRRRWPLALGAAAVSGLLGLGVGYAIGAGGLPGLAADEGAGPAVPGESAKPTWTAPARANSAGGGAAVPPGSPASQPAVASAAPDDGEDEAGAAGDAGPSDEEADDESGHVADGDSQKGKHWLRRDRCGVDVRSDPDGADVAVGGQVLGSTPARIELPCGAQEIEVRRSRYMDAQRRVRLRPGKPDRVDVHLERPDHKLRIVSAPLGATVTVNGKPAGTTPLVMTVKGYQQIRVRIERTGFEPWTRKLYAREPQTKVTAKLTPERAPAPAAHSPAQPQPKAPTPAGPTLPTLSLPTPDAGGG